MGERNIFRLFLGIGILLGFSFGELHAQCPNDNSFYLNLTPSGAGDTATSLCTYGGEYITVNVCNGASYSFTTCAGGGFDTQLTLKNDATGADIAFNDNFGGCGTRSRINWVATFSGTVRLLLDQKPCNHNSICMRIDVIQNTACPPPANDDPCGAPTITVNTSCQYDTFSTLGATATTNATNPTCGNYLGGDVWFKFVVPTSGNVAISTNSLSFVDGAMQVYDDAGACFLPFVLTKGCNDDGSPDSQYMPFMGLSGLTPGVTLYIRFWVYGNSVAGDFEICVYEPVPPGGNPCGASIPDSIQAACHLGTLMPPRLCDGSPNEGDGTPSNFTLSNTGATASNPYIYQANCLPSGNMASPSADVWYTFTSMATNLEVTITGLNTPNVAIWEGTPSNLIGRGCAIGGSGSLTTTFELLRTGTTYYLQISGANLSDTGSFSLTLENHTDCSDCVGTSTLTASPAPVNGSYPPGTSVSFTYTIWSYNRVSDNWLHGVVPSFGSGWDTTTLAVTPALSCDGFGNWAWQNSVTSLANGSTHGPGFFYDTQQGQSPAGLPDGDYGNNYGDNCIGSWRFTWTVSTVNSGCIGGDDLRIQIETLTDAESGNWTTPACSGDPDYIFTAGVACALPIVLLDFDVERTPYGNQLNWTTEREIINNYFEIERSLDGKNFVPVKQVQAGGTTDAPKDYEFLDNYRSDWTVHYRLKQVDFNGNFSYSETRTLTGRQPEVAIQEVYPNPVKSQMSLLLSLPKDGTYLIRIHDLLGRALYTQQMELEKGSTELHLPVDDLATGTYTVTISASGVSASKRFIKE